MKSVQDLYGAAQEVKQKADTHKEIARIKEAEYGDLIKQYRVESVCEVLGFIKHEYNRKRICNLDTLLTHCMNKLHGNIDGVELKLDEGIPFERKEQELTQIGE